MGIKSFKHWHDEGYPQSIPFYPGQQARRESPAPPKPLNNLEISKISEKFGG
jgi:hypothetical protein